MKLRCLVGGFLGLSFGVSFGQLPPDSAYVTSDGKGHLTVEGKPIRFRGAIGNLPPDQKTIKGDPYYVAKETVRRLKKVGFNMVRDWGIATEPLAKKGDLSKTDHHDFFLAECARQGVRIWVPSVMGGGCTTTKLPWPPRAMTRRRRRNGRRRCGEWPRLNGGRTIARRCLC